MIPGLNQINERTNERKKQNRKYHLDISEGFQFIAHFRYTSENAHLDY